MFNKTDVNETLSTQTLWGFNTPQPQASIPSIWTFNTTIVNATQLTKLQIAAKV